MKYRYDQLQFSSVIPNFINLGTLTGTINCSGTIANGTGANFQVQVNTNNFSTFNDIKITNTNTNKSTYLTDTWDIDILWQFVSTETVQNQVTFIGTLCTVQISVFNGTGGSITLTSQSYTVEIIEYQLPF